jgi:hypothetical protein
MRRKGNTIFTTSLYKINRILESRKEDKEDISQQQAFAQATTVLLGLVDQYAEDNELVQQKLTGYYQRFIDVFSKQASNKLPPFCPQVNHKIELLSENTLGHSPLYRQTIEELLAIKEYLLENLSKGFIIPSLAPFASLVLFVKKPDGSLRFYIDYCKLNQITKKDQYPLPLIDKTLARISQAKIFTKLNIC